MDSDTARGATIEEFTSGRLGSTWSETSVELGVRARFSCEYCSRDLLASVDAYDSWQTDHVVPISKGGGETDFDNLALSCRTCNMLKRAFDPSSEVGEGAGRDQLIAAARKYVQDKRSSKLQEVASVRALARQLVDL